MNETELKFLIIENALREMKFDCRILPGKLAKNLKLIREQLNWIERNHLPSGLSKAMMSRIKEKIIYLSAEKDKNAVAFQIHNIIRRPYIPELVGIKITFGTSENGNPGLLFEGTRQDPVIVKVTDLPWITEKALESPKKFEKWIKDHAIEPSKLSEKVEQFAVVDLGIVELNELGLCELEHKALDQKEVDELKEKKKPKTQPKAATSTPTPLKPTTPPIYRPQTGCLSLVNSGFKVDYNDMKYVTDWGGDCYE